MRRLQVHPLPAISRTSASAERCLGQDGCTEAVGSGHSVATVGRPSTSALICSHKSLRAAPPAQRISPGSEPGRASPPARPEPGDGLHDAPHRMAAPMSGHHAHEYLRGLGEPDIGSQPQPVGARRDLCGQGRELIEVGPIGQLPTIPLEIVGRDVAEGHPPVEPLAKGRPLVHSRPELRAELIGALNGRQHRAGGLGDHAWLDVARADRSGVLVEAADDETARRRQSEPRGRPRIDRSEVRSRANYRWAATSRQFRIGPASRATSGNDGCPPARSARPRRPR